MKVNELKRTTQRSHRGGDACAWIETLTEKPRTINAQRHLQASKIFCTKLVWECWWRVISSWSNHHVSNMAESRRHGNASGRVSWRWWLIVFRLKRHRRRRRYIRAQIEAGQNVLQEQLVTFKSATMMKLKEPETGSNGGSGADLGN